MEAFTAIFTHELKDIFDTITDMITVHDMDFNILHANEAAKEMLQLPSSSVTKMKCFKYYHGTGGPPKGCPSCECLKTGLPAAFELFEPHLNKNIEIRAIPRFDGNNRAIGLIHIVRDITQRKQSEEQLRSLTAHLLTVREEERKKIAREIHDELGQQLTAMKMDICWLNKKLPQELSPLLDKTESMIKRVDTTIYSVQRISSELRPGLLDDLGLQAAMEWQAKEFQNRTGIDCKVTFDFDNGRVGQECAIAIFRIFQETLTNIVRHAEATKVKVSLKEKHGALVMEVIDNGKGITVEQISNPKSFGLIGMQERIYFLRGKVKINGAQGKGTRVRVSIPQGKPEQK
ncbi:MAG: PAS domain-containing protein [Nitrospirae bacterium]|nr:PAS domain-containing protein [Nitrospirota bacterium]